MFLKIVENKLLKVDDPISRTRLENVTFFKESLFVYNKFIYQIEAFLNKSKKKRWIVDSERYYDENVFY